MATTWNTIYEANPGGGNDPAYGDDAIREAKTATRERLEKEHEFSLAEAGLQPRQGLHKAGSAVAFRQASAPTARNGNALGSSDAGLIWLETGTSNLYMWSGTAWDPIRAYVQIVTDANSAVTEGIYEVATPFLSVPTAEAYTLLVTEVGGVVRQVAFASGSNNIFTRRYAASAWGAWVGLWKVGDAVTGAVWQ